ncbi:MAG: aminotransferase class V-fold PLP-dependent enzyme [Oscillospiraceae bacterium]
MVSQAKVKNIIGGGPKWTITVYHIQGGIVNIISCSYEHELAKINGLHLIGTAAQKSSALSFILDGYDNETVGHHCAQPILRSYGLEGVVRPTLALYNSPEDIDRLVRAIRSLT